MGPLSKRHEFEINQMKQKNSLLTFFEISNIENEPKIDLSEGYAKIVHMVIGQNLLTAGNSHD